MSNKHTGLYNLGDIYLRYSTAKSKCDLWRSVSDEIHSRRERVPVCKWGYNSHSRGTTIIPFTLTSLLLYTLAGRMKERNRQTKRDKDIATKKEREMDKNERKEISFSFSRLSRPIKRTPGGVGNRRDELLQFLHK